MNLTFRQAVAGDIPAVLALLMDDTLGSKREGGELDLYLAAFRQMDKEGNNRLIVGLLGEQIVATYQVTFISGLSLRATRRAQVESVRVASAFRGQKIGEMMIADAETRAREAGCTLLQLTMNKTRIETARFYQRLGFTPSHIGYKRNLT